MVSKTAWLQTFFRISSFVFRTNTFIQVWKYLRLSKWWQKLNCWVNCPFKTVLILAGIFDLVSPCVSMFILSILNSTWDYNKCVPKHSMLKRACQKSPGWSIISGRFWSVDLTAKIAHNPLLFGEGFNPELQTRVKHVTKTTNVVDVRYRPLGREVWETSNQHLTW